MTAAKSRWSHFATPVSIFTRYQNAGLEYFALKVVGRGLFLVLMLMVGFLFVFTFVTSLLVGVNEVVVPTVDIDASVDLGNLVASTFSRVSGAVVSTSGVLVLVVSALLTAFAIRQGSHRAFAQSVTVSPRLFQLRTCVGAVVISSLIMLTWLTTLATAIRHRAWEGIFGREIPDWAVDLSKFLLVVAVIAIVVLSIATYVRAISQEPTTFKTVGIATLVAGIFVGASFGLLYTYVGALVNPAASTGLLLVLALLLWVNVVVRSYLMGLCWVACIQAPKATQA